jgi:FtsP/CotA-like multicopper oxidase with cupredoxin domain
MHLLKHGWSRLARTSWRNRQELIAERLTTRRELLKLGLLGAGGLLLAKHGLSSRVASAAEMVSPPTRAFIEPLPIMPVKRPLPNGVNDLSPFPSIVPNNAGGEGRTRAHQAFSRYPENFAWPPAKAYEIRQREALVRVSPDLPLQRMWGFDGMVPGPTYHAKYGEQILVRNRNELPANNFGFGMRQVSTHLHNAHTPSESDGFPSDFFPNRDDPATANAWFYDHHYPNVCAGFSSTHKPYGDRNESLSTLWYHDHRIMFTSQNVYKGLAGFYLLYNDYDCGDESNPYGCRLPGVRSTSDFHDPVKYDVPLFLADRLFDDSTGQMYFDLFEKDGIIGDKYLVNGKIQPYFQVEPRRYRFRILDGGPSRFYQLFLTDRQANTSIPFWLVGNDGNLMPRPVKATSVILSVAERMDVVVDFSRWAGKTLYLENRLAQADGRGPDANLGAPFSLVPPGQGNFILQFRVGATASGVDQSIDFDTNPRYAPYAMPSLPVTRVSRSFRFERVNNLWVINGKLFPDDASEVRLRVKQDTAERWTFVNKSGGWMHPIHVHFEEYRMLARNGRQILPGDPEYCRKDVVRLQHGEQVTGVWRFRDFAGRYPMHCHNLLHEDHAMMLRFDIDDTGDSSGTP